MCPCCLLDFACSHTEDTLKFLCTRVFVFFFCLLMHHQNIRLLVLFCFVFVFFVFLFLAGNQTRSCDAKLASVFISS